MDVWLITDDGSLAEAVAAALAHVPDLRLRQARRAAAAGAATVLLLGADRLAELPGAGAPVLLLVPALDLAALRAAYRAGAADCLLVPDELGALPAAVRRAAGAAGGEGRVYALYSAKGGSGRTLLAALLAVALQVRAHRRTLLVDLNLQFGGADVLLDLHPDRHVGHLLPLAAELTPEQLSRAACLHPSGLAALCSPADPTVAAACDPGAVGKLLAACRCFYDAVVADLPASLDAVTLGAMGVADRVLYVATPDALAVASLQRALACLRTAGSPAPARLGLVVNRAARAADLRPADLAALSGLPVLGTVRADFRRIQPLLSGDRGCLSPEAAGGPGRDIARLAAALVGLP